MNDFKFQRGEALFAVAMKIAPNIAWLKKRAKDAGVPAIYVNDNFGGAIQVRLDCRTLP